MPILSIEQMLGNLQMLTNGRTNDDELQMIAEVTETVNMLYGSHGDNPGHNGPVGEPGPSANDIDIKIREAVEANDTKWREKYRETFFHGKDDAEEIQQTKPKKKGTAALFTEKEE